MKCINCNNPQPEYSFRVLEVHTLHVRDFGGEKLIQALGETRTFEVCAACVSSEMRASLYPAERILRRCAGFVALFLAGIVLTLTLGLRDVMNALRVIGPLCMFVGVSGTIARIRETLSRRRLLAGMTEPKALKFCAWQCVLKVAPKKYNDNDITYIPVDEETAGLSVRELAEKYCLIPAIANQVHSTIISFCGKLS